MRGNCGTSRISKALGLRDWDLLHSGVLKFYLGVLKEAINVQRLRVYKGILQTETSLR